MGQQGSKGGKKSKGDNALSRLEDFKEQTACK